MLTREEDVEIHALAKRGWTISAIARHTGRDRKTVRTYLSGKRTPGVRRRSAPDAFGPFEHYCTLRLREDPHLWATTLYDEVAALGYPRSYPTFTRELRRRALRPDCEPCGRVRGPLTIELDHPPGEEIQWDWLELPGAPWGETAHLLVGTLPHSGKARARFAPEEDQAHLIEALDGVLRALGGTARRWRVDRLATVVDPASGRIQASFAPVARHYGVGVDPCPPRRANRKGSVEKTIHYLTQRWWRTAQVATPAEAQASLDRFLAEVADRRRRRDPQGGWTTVGELAQREGLAPLPELPYPATVIQMAPVGPSALVAYGGNRYSVPPELFGAEVTLRHRLGSDTLEILSQAGTPVATHRLAPRGAGAVVRSPEHRAALEGAVLAAFTTAPPCPRKPNRPPGEEAQAEAARLLGAAAPGSGAVDLSRYAEWAGVAR